MYILFVGVEDYGWKGEGKLHIIWEVADNILKSQQKISYVLNGCACKTGCKIRQCKCKKNDTICGPGCHCVNCSNLLTVGCTSTCMPQDEYNDEDEEFEKHDSVEQNELIEDSEDDDERIVNLDKLE